MLFVMKHRSLSAWFFSLLLYSCLASCTSIEVRPLPPGIDEVVVHENPKVQVSGFLQLLEQAFRDHGILVTTVSQPEVLGPGYVVTHTARRSWDFTTYLSKAEIWVWRDGTEVAYANYYLTGGGGLDLSKYDDVETKMAPVFEQLFVHYPRRIEAVQ